jgi:hypothetical protein
MQREGGIWQYCLEEAVKGDMPDLVEYLKSPEGIFDWDLDSEDEDKYFEMKYKFAFKAIQENRLDILQSGLLSHGCLVGDSEWISAAVRHDDMDLFKFVMECELRVTE